MIVELLTVKDVSNLRGCGVRYIQSLISKNKIEHQEIINCKGIKQYLIPLNALDPALQLKYYRQNHLPIPEELRPKKAAKTPERVKSLEEFTEEQRQEISCWITILEDWQDFRNGYDGSKAEADAAFLEEARGKYPEIIISKDILYRKWKAYRVQDMDGLIDRRGLWKKGTSSIDRTIWRVFLSYYLDQECHPITECVKYTRLWLVEKKLNLPVPHESSFRRRIEQDIPEAVVAYKREGRKALHDRFEPYIKRLYEHMQSNDYWVADNHTFDFMTQGENGRPHRLYLTAIIDARSTAFMGWKVTHAPCGDATIAAIRDAIATRDHGIPKYLYVDNGSEFLMHDVGGRGHRKRKSQADEFEPPPILKRLGITMLNAIPGNPEAKIIERIFLDIKNQFSRTTDTFCGGTIMERPERLNGLLKSGEIPTDEELIQAISNFLEGYYNHLPYHGAVRKDHGKPKIQVYAENLLEVRKPASMDDLNLMLMRSSRPVKVGRRGVHINIAGFGMDYWTDDFLLNWQDKKVYYRYDPENLNTVRVYTAPGDQYIGTLPVDNEALLEYGASCEKIKNGMRKVNQFAKRVKEWDKDYTLDKQDRISAYMLIQMDAQRSLEKAPDYAKPKPKVVHLVQADEQLYEPLPVAVGELAPLDTMIFNATRYYGGNEDG